MKTRIKIIALLLVLGVLLTVVLATPITSEAINDRLGAFTGPEGGADQDDNLKASLDLAHTDLDTLIGENEGLRSLLKESTGSIFYVDSAMSGTTGVTWALAVDDIEEAVALLTANAGDIVLFAPGHAETIGGAAAIDLDVAGVHYEGLGKGQLMATLSYDTTTDTLAIGATGDGTTLKNVKFIATVTAVANAIVVEAGCTDFVIEDCVFENETAGTDEFIDAILVSGTASDRGIIRNNRFVSDTSENAGPKASINFVDCDYLQIYGNQFFGDHGDASIFNETTASNFVSIHDNTIHQGAIGDAKLDTTPGISLVATTTGMIFDNTIATNVASPDLAIVAADCHVFNNSYSETQGSNLEVGKTYWLTKDAVNTGGTDDLFLVAGGNIVITHFFGEITTLFGGSPGDMTIELDSTDDDYDTDFSTTVTVDTAAEGDWINFDDTIAESVLGFAPNVSSIEPIRWLCSPGMIEQTLTSTGTGVTVWHIGFIPVEEGVTVTAQ